MTHIQRPSGLQPFQKVAKNDAPLSQALGTPKMLNANGAIFQESAFMQVLLVVLGCHTHCLCTGPMPILASWSAGNLEADSLHSRASLIQISTVLPRSLLTLTHQLPLHLGHCLSLSALNEIAASRALPHDMLQIMNYDLNLPWLMTTARCSSSMLVLGVNSMFCLLSVRHLIVETVLCLSQTPLHRFHLRAMTSSTEGHCFKCLGTVLVARKKWITNHQQIPKELHSCSYRK